MRELSAKEKELLYRIENKPDLRPFFFRKAKGLHWFDPLNEKGFFSPEQNPKPVPAREEGYVNIPPWPAVEYLVATAPELSSPENEPYAVRFLEVIRSVTDDAQRNGYGNYRTWWQFSKIICSLPTKLVKEDDLDLIGYWLDDQYNRDLVAIELGKNWLPKLLAGDEHSTKLALGVLDRLFSVIFTEDDVQLYDRRKALFRFNSLHAKGIAGKVARISGERVGLKAVKIFESKLTTLLKELNNDDWSSIWRSAIEEIDQNNRADDVGDILIAAFRDSLLGAVDHDLESLSEYLKQLLLSEYRTLRRVGIYIVDKKFDQLDILTEHVIVAEHFSDNLRHEVWNFLNHNYLNIHPSQKTKVLEIIESLSIPKDDGSVEEGLTAYKRSVWFSAIKDADQQANALYRKYIEVTGTEPEHPDFANYMSVEEVRHESPIPVEELLALSVDKLIQRIDSYEDPGLFGKPGLEGLVKAFREVVKLKANEIYIELDKLSNLDLAFVYEVIEAYYQLWSEKSAIQWKDIWPRLLDYCARIVNNSEFWSEENSKKRERFVATRHWVVGSIARLIEAGTKSDEHAFEPPLLPQAKEILLLLLARQEGEEFKNESDAVFVAMNSPRGQCIEALINHSLRFCRLADKEKKQHSSVWKEYESIYNDELRRSDQGEYEFSTLVARYLPNFLYMSREWVHNNLSQIFNQADYQKWLCAMQGYTYVNTVYKDIYKYLKDHDDFIKALDDKNLKDHDQEKVIQNIVVSYISDDESLDDVDSLISLLLERKQFRELQHLIWFIWTLRGKDHTALPAKVSELWPRLLQILNYETKEGRQLASSLCHWATFIGEIDENNRAWLLSVAPYAEEDYNSHELLDSLARISRTQPFEAQQIWLAMLSSYSDAYPEDSIKEILINLIAVGQEGERRAKEVVDAYLKHGVERPRIWLNEIKQHGANV